MMISDLKHGLFKYDVKDYYAILGVPIDANVKDIRLRYLKIAYQLHPDTNQAETPEGKTRASDILSKLVNPAYENLYKDKLRKECELIISDMGRRLASDSSQVTFNSDSAKKLLQEEKKAPKIYHEMIEKFANEQYQDLDKLSLKISLISELNMAYLISQKTVEFNKVSLTSNTSQIKIGESSISQKLDNIESSFNSNEQVNESITPTQPKVSRLDKLISSAKQHLENQNYEQGIIDLREAVKLDSNSSTVHGLLGTLYVKQSNLTYGRIHINKAMALDNNNPIAQQAQQELKDIEKKQKSANSSSSSKSSSPPKDTKTTKSIDKDKDNKGKKEAPKIFGISLW